MYIYICIYVYICVWKNTVRKWVVQWCDHKTCGFNGIFVVELDITHQLCRLIYIYTCYIYIHVMYNIYILLYTCHMYIYMYIYIYMYVYIYMLYIYTYMLTVIYYRWNDGVWGIIPNWSRIAFVAAYLWPLWPSWSMVKIHILPGIISYPNCTGIRWSSSFIVVVCACCNWSL